MTKDCPSCGKVYSDLAQQFCLECGAALVSSEEVVTVDAVKVQTVEAEPKKQKGFLLGALSALGIVVALGLIGGAVYYFAVINQTPVSSVSSNSNQNEDSKTLGSGFSAEDSVAEKKTYVNSPNDGFLALRSIPNHKTGKLVAKIPHGTEIQLSTCSSLNTIGGKKGRWCKTTYKEKNGWVFSAWTVKR